MLIQNSSKSNQSDFIIFEQNFSEILGVVAMKLSYEQYKTAERIGSNFISDPNDRSSEANHTRTYSVL